MKTESKLKNVILLGVISSSLQAADKNDFKNIIELIKSRPKNEIPSNALIVNKLVETQGVKTWITNDVTINELDLEPIKYKLVTEDNVQGLTLEQVDQIAEKYRAFLYLSKKYPNRNIVPNKEVDMFWHAHILDTYKYQEDCEKIFGRFFHHYPYFGMKDGDDAKNLEDSFNETLDLYKKEFPSKISKNIISNSALCIGEGSRMKALCIGEGSRTKALCIGEGVRNKMALCGADIGTETHIERVEKNDGTFEKRSRPRFDRKNGDVIFQ